MLKDKLSSVTNCYIAAPLLYEFGFNVIPVAPGGKNTLVKWDQWLEDLSEEKILRQWPMDPIADVGFIVGKKMVAIDADSPEALKSLITLEQDCNCIPNMVVATARGEHHYFGCPPDVYVKTSGHGKDGPEQAIDVKTDRSMVVLPPSVGKSIKTLDANNVSELTEVSQHFLDALHIFKGQSIQRPYEALTDSDNRPRYSGDTENVLAALLDQLDPDMDYVSWRNVGMAVFHETSGSDTGLNLFDRWSSNGNKYPGRQNIETKWRSFSIDIPNPITIRTICKMVDDAGGDWMTIMSEAETPFEVLEVETEVTTTVTDKDIAAKSNNPFEGYSLTGQSERLERDAADRVNVLGEIALLGQLTAIYAKPNQGKTLLTLKLLTESIAAGRVDPLKAIYVNADDDSKGLVEKLKIVEEFGFHMLAEGYEGFSANNFLNDLKALIVSDQAKGYVIVLDTAKKFVDLMSKRECRDFNLVLGAFAAKGGTIIALAHTNKNDDEDGNPIHAGTTDIREDFSCVYTLKEVSQGNTEEKVVMFENIKARGPVAKRACYSYVCGKDIHYDEMFMSVREVSENELTKLEQAEEMRSDNQVIEAVISCINDGTNTKMLLAEEAAKRSGASKRSTLQLIAKYTGGDPSKHRWNFVRGERGKQIYSVFADHAE